jgi:hypothetical protein
MQKKKPLNNLPTSLSDDCILRHLKKIKYRKVSALYTGIFPTKGHVFRENILGDINLQRAPLETSSNSKPT